MAAASSVVPLQETDHLQFWEQFQRSAEWRVRECNAVAGEPLWRITMYPEPVVKFVVEAGAWRGDWIECSLDLRRGILTCRPGPAIKSRRCQFRIIGGAAGMLRRGAQTFTADTALSEILDSLVWMDD